MSRAFAAAAALLLVAVTAHAQPLQDPLLDAMAGSWVLRGTIAGRATVHDVTFAWVLNHEYLQMREVAREKGADGRPAYEAVVFIGRAPHGEGYACLWLDDTGGGGLAAQAIGRGTRSGDEIAFLFKGDDGSVFHTTFAYERAAGAWAWRMDGEERGALKPFARVRLTRE